MNMELDSSFLAFDLGASSGRAVVGTLEGAAMTLNEVHRFPTPLVEEAGHLYWDIDSLWEEIRRGLAKALAVAPTLRSVSVDSWAVDYVPLDRDGRPVRRPYAYRDPRTKGRLATAIALAGGADKLYARTGIQFMEINTLPQIVADLADEPELVSRTAQRLLIAEYFLYCLCGSAVAERTMASTTQLMDAHSGDWAWDLIQAIGDDSKRWPRIVPAGTVLGAVRPDLMPLDASDPPLVVAGCAHDTAAAVAAVPALESPWVYISSGTWSLVGVELNAPILTTAARDAGFTNEAGLDGTVRFLKNRTGMWIIEECLREWSANAERPSYDALMADAADAQFTGGTLDLNTPEFGERGRMTEKLERACRARGIRVPSNRGALVRLVLESLAASYAQTLDELALITGQRAELVHIVGGGARNELLNQLTANAGGCVVIAGPAEATVLGNLLVQAHALGALPPGLSVRDAARSNITLARYYPRGAEHRSTEPLILPA